ncbi:Long-chain-fatty-acid--CoA ligase 5 [Apophysomyces ossiformis]|uniref:Long-chain-fatty-acid--CoA ligase 5 n=1 Tax=Apophysomyces ossiformis TaxID=679940 RepID=A0A8H7ERI2_9FUNG|nr:Long-chain-fatty-acid--CoA ligase 5 [Apophysomyces ossiformis]
MSIELDTLSYALLASIFGAATLLSIKNSKEADIHPLLLNNQANVSPLRHPGESAIYRSRASTFGSPLLATFDRNVRTLHDLFQDDVFAKHGSTPFVGAHTKNGYEWHNYDTVGSRCEHIYAGLCNVGGLEPRSGTESSFVGIYASNSPDTVLAQIACHRHGLVTIPIGAHSSSSHVSHILRNTSLKLLLVDEALLDRTLSLVDETTALKYIVTFGASSSEQKQAAEKVGIHLVSLTEVQDKGQLASVESVRPVPEDMASIYFRGKQGIILTHKNLLSSIASYLLIYTAILTQPHKITAKDRLMHTYPIDHVFGYVLTGAFCTIGASVAIGHEVDEEANIDLSSVLATVAEAKPTVFGSVKPFFEQVKGRVESQYGNSFLFRRGYDKKQHHLAEGRLVNDTKYDMLVFRDIRQKLFGGHLRIAYIENGFEADDLVSFLRVVLGAQILKAFNQTETTGTATVSMCFDYGADPAAFGAPLACNEVKLLDLPERQYSSEDQPNPRGEIWVRGNNVFAGYWKDPEATAQVVDSDGWYTTGMIGEFLPNGAIKLLSQK